MKILALFLLLPLVMALVEEDGFTRRDYQFLIKQSTFAFMILPKPDAEQWTICFSYDTDTQLDPAYPGRFPVEQCGEQSEDSFVDGFVAIHVKYNGTNQTEVFLLSAQKDVWFRLGDAFVSFNSSDAMVFDFYRNPGRDHLALHGYPSRFYLPEFYDEKNLTLALAFNSTDIESVHSSLTDVTPRKEKSPTRTDDQLTLFSAELTTTIAAPEETFNEAKKTVLGDPFAHSFLKEAISLLPSLKRSVSHESTTTQTSPTTRTSGTTQKIGTKTTLRPPFTTKEAIFTSAHWTTTTRFFATTRPINQKKALVKSELTTRSRAATTHNIHSSALPPTQPSTPSIGSTPQTTSTASSKSAEGASRPVTHPTTSFPTTRQPKEEEFWEELMNPKAGSAVRVVGREDDDEEDTPPELLQFELADRLLASNNLPLRAPPFLPPFPPFNAPNTSTPTNQTTQSPCHFPPNPPEWASQFPSGFPPFGPMNQFPNQFPFY